ncbi:MAG: hypothetical protein Fues2KO_47560 [Fuerstiella sp.]
MLVLSRNSGEEVVIRHNGEELTLRVYDLGHGKAKLAFDGPRSFEILRAEVLQNERRKDLRGGL